MLNGMFKFVLPLVLCWATLTLGGTPRAVTETELGIPIYPGARLLAVEGPSTELVDLQRDGWIFVTAEVLVADFLFDDPIVDLRLFYRELCERDPKLLLVRKGSPEGELVAVHYAGRHPTWTKKRWLRIMTYRRIAAETAQRAGE